MGGRINYSKVLCCVGLPLLLLVVLRLLLPDGGIRPAAAAVGEIKPAEPAATAEATAVGYVYYDGLPVAGALVLILRDHEVLFNATTSLGSGSVPSFTVSLTGLPVPAVLGEVLTLEVSYGSDEWNLSNFIVQPGPQVLAGWLSSSCGETEISEGVIADDTVWTPECGPYLIRENLLVDAGATLTIEAGTTVMTNGNKAIQFNGRLLAQGGPSALVTFTTSQGLAWAYLSFSGSSTGSELDYTLVEYAGSSSVDHNGSIRVDGVDAAFNQVIVREGLAGGIQVFNDGQTTIEGSKIINNGGWGIAVDSDTAGLIIDNCQVAANVGGIWVKGGASGGISYNTIRNNWGNGGIKLESPGTMAISHNQITNNQATNGGGIYSYGGYVTITDNIIATNEASGAGGGLYYYYSNSQMITRIARNYFLYNAAGHSTYGGSGMHQYGRNIEIDHNIFAYNGYHDASLDNSGPGGGLNVRTYSGTNPTINVHHNSFVYNRADIGGGAAIFVNNNQQVVLTANSIVSNTVINIPVTTFGAIQLANVIPLNNNNFFGNNTYALSNKALLAAGTVNAQSNWWGTSDSNEIRDRIYDWFDNATLGVVDYANWLSGPWTDAPVTPPGGLTAEVSEGTITASWAENAESDLAGYKLYLSTEEALFVPAIQGWPTGLKVGPVTTFSVSCLPADTYYLALTAYDHAADGEADWTDGHESWFTLELELEVSSGAVCAPPALPTALVAVAASNSLVNLSWTDNATDESGYRVERSPNGATDWVEIAKLAANSQAYSDGGLSCGTAYFYRVRAFRFGDGQYSSYSNNDQATTTTCEPPVTPTGLNATAVSPSQINLSWSDNAGDETGYRVERSPNGTSGWSEIASLAANSSAFSDTGLVCNTTYYYRVRSHRAADGQYSSFSNVAHDTTQFCTPPTAPTGLGATAISPSQINLSWSDNAGDETGYRVERSPNGTSGWSEIASLAANSNTFNNTGLSCNTVYYYRVRAYRAGDGQYSSYSNVAHDTTQACTPPTAPTGLNATAVSPSQINLSWSDNAGDETGYRVERSPNGTSSWSEIGSLGADSQTFSDTGLACNTSFYYRVRAYRAGDGQYSSYSNVAHDTTQFCTPPAAPTGLSASAVSASQINLSWSDNAGDETGYRVEQSPNGTSSWSEIASLGANSHAFSDSGLACNGMYYYRVRAYRAGDGQYSSYSNVAHDTTQACPPPVAPTGLSATAISASQINLSWTDNAGDESGYRVERSPNGTSNWSEIASLGTNSCAFSDSGLEYNKTYYYRVRAYRAGDGQYSSYSNLAHDTTILGDLVPVACLPMVIKGTAETDKFGR